MSINAHGFCCYITSFPELNRSLSIAPTLARLFCLGSRGGVITWNNFCRMSDYEKPADSPTVQEQNEHYKMGDAGGEETIGTLIVDETESGRRTLRPQPSLDPNDPLVYLPAEILKFKL